MTMITNSSSVPDDEPSVPGPRGRDGPRRRGRFRAVLHQVTPEFLGVEARPVEEFPKVGGVHQKDGEKQVLGVGEGQTFLVRLGGSSRVDLQACKLGTGRRFTTS
jgi:hypothetical protein